MQKKKGLLLLIAATSMGVAQATPPSYWRRNQY